MTEHEDRKTRERVFIDSEAVGDKGPSLYERLATIENEVRWLKYLVILVFAATMGEYLGLRDEVAQAMQHALR